MANTFFNYRLKEDQGIDTKIEKAYYMADLSIDKIIELLAA